MDYVSRRLAHRLAPLLILDFRRVASITTAGALLLTDMVRGLKAAGTNVILAGMPAKQETWATINPLVRDIAQLNVFSLLDEAIEWAEDQVIAHHGGERAPGASADLKDQAILVAENELSRLADLGIVRHYPAGERIIAANEPANSLFFLQSGMVSVKLPSGVRLATLDRGMEFGEMALLDERRTADVWADTDVTCLELPIEELNRFRREHPHIGEHIGISPRFLHGDLSWPTRKSIC
jgi:glutaminase